MPQHSPLWPNNWIWLIFFFFLCSGDNINILGTLWELNKAIYSKMLHKIYNLPRHCYFPIITAIHVAKTQSIPCEVWGSCKRIPLPKPFGSHRFCWFDRRHCEVLCRNSEPPSPFHLKWQNCANRNKGWACQHSRPTAEQSAVSTEMKWHD